MSGRENREGQTAKKTTQQRVRQREKGADRVKEIQRERERETDFLDYRCPWPEAKCPRRKY